MVRRFIFVLLLGAIGISSFAQASSLWEDVSEISVAGKESMRQIVPQKYRLVALDFKAMSVKLKTLNTWNQGDTFVGKLLELPTPDGKMQQFKVVEASIFAPELAAKYPKIKSFKGWAVDNPGINVRFDISPKGFHAMVLSDNRTWFIDPYAKGDTKHYVVYDKKNYVDNEPFTCQFADEKKKIIKNNLLDDAEVGDCQFRTYRLALACTGEYAQFHGGTVNDVLAAMNTTMTRVNGVYERELAVTMVIVANDDQLIYLDGATDPYTNDDGQTMLGENQTTVDNVIGTANYDIGHVFSTGGGGIAALHSPCTSYKAQGVTGRPDPVGDPFDIDYVAHEMGHQFGAHHTQNNACNRTDATAMEPGSASTIMGYAGICYPNVQNHSDAYFHAISLQEIHANITSGPSSGCPTVVALNNTPPVVNGGADYHIPVSTPFVLTAIGADDDGDPITYCWEQMNSETAAMPPESTATGGPAFRSFNPTASPKRYFPRLEDILTNTTPTWEVLPSVSRTMDFQVTIRDNHPGGGCNSEDMVTVTTEAAAGPFLVTVPNTNVDWSAQSLRTVTWDVANTTAAPINAQMVDILLSFDGGHTYPEVLASNVPNDGSQQVTMPAQTTSTARIMVKAHDNIFFDVSNTNFTISAAQAGFAVALSPDSLFLCAPATGTTDMTLTSIAGFTGNVSIAATNVPSGMSVEMNPVSLDVPGLSVVSVNTTDSLADGDHVLHLEVTGSPGTISKELYVFSAQADPMTPTLTGPADGSTGTSVLPQLTWEVVPNAQTYRVEVFADSNLTTLIESKMLTNQTSYQMSTVLNPATTYYWRVSASNPCHENVASTVFSFTTKAIFCSGFTAADIPVAIPTNATGTISSTIHIAEAGSLTSIRLTNLDISHTWINDLIIKLISPDGSEVLLLNQICNGEDNILMSFDDASANAYAAIPCPPVGGETYHPYGNLNDFLGKDIQGDWTLQIEDLYSGDGGSLNGWSLALCYLVDSLTLAVQTTDVTCFGSADGSAQAVVAGGTIPYTYAWSGGSNSHLSAGSYSVTVTDADGNTTVGDFVIQSPDPIQLTANITNASSGGTDGAVDLMVTGGTPAYAYNWSTGAQTEDIAGLAENTYYVTVTDAHSCLAQDSFVVTESCPIPTAINVEVQSNSAVVTWASAAGVNSYQIRYRVEGATTWQTRTVSTNTVTLTNLTPEATYEYQIQGHCTGGWSVYSTLDTFTMPSSCDAPVNVTSITVSSTEATIGWDVVAAATGYVVRYRELGATSWLMQSENGTSIQLTGLNESTTYEMSVMTNCGNYSSDYGDVFIFTTQEGCTVPSNIVATALSYQSIRLQWDEIPGVSQYAVRYRLTDANTWESINVSGTAVTINNLEAGATYEYQVQSKCGFAWSDYSLLAEVSLPSGCDVTGLVSESVSANSINLSWNAISGVSQYRLSYRLAGSSDDWMSFEITEPVGRIENIHPNSVYAIFVQAYCDLGWGPESTTINVQTSPDGLSEQLSGPAFMLYPNPVGNYLMLEFSAAPQEVVIMNMLGQVILTEKADSKMEIPFSNADAGLYLVRVIYRDGTERVGKFLKE